MKNPNKLPPEIKGIREMVAQGEYESCKNAIKGLGLSMPTWENLREDKKEWWYREARPLLSKLTEHGVVVLVSGDKFGTNLSTGNSYYEVINLDGTPVKEG